MVQIPRLREWREARALTQVELARLAHVSSRSVAGYEAGAGARPPTVRRLAEVLGIEVADLRGDTDFPKGPRRSSLEPSFNDLLDERRAGVTSGVSSWAAYTRQLADRIRGHADDPVSPAFRDPWTALFFVEEANRNAADLFRFLDWQLSAALEVADVEGMRALTAAGKELDSAIGTASERADLMEAGRSQSELGEARRRAKEAEADRRSAEAWLAGHSGHSA